MGWRRPLRAGLASIGLHALIILVARGEFARRSERALEDAPMELRLISAPLGGAGAQPRPEMVGGLAEGVRSPRPAGLRVAVKPRRRGPRAAPGPRSASALHTTLHLDPEFLPPIIDGMGPPAPELRTPLAQNIEAPPPSPPGPPDHPLALGLEAPPPRSSPGQPASAGLPRPKVSAEAGGAYRYRDERFEMKIDVDGSFRFEDRTQVHEARGQDDPLLGIGGLNPFVYDRGRPDVHESDPDPKFIARTGKIDLNDMILRLRGEDPYRHEKGRALQETGELRAELCERSRMEDLKAFLLRLPGELRAIWAREDRTEAERRAMLFEVWDQCREEGTAEAAKYADAARELVIDFIHENMPPSSLHAYTVDEIAALNARRRSRDSFLPYGAAVDAGTDTSASGG